jgi:hypothetical protein
MRMVYKVLAFAVAGLVVVQAAAVAFGVFGLLHWIEGGGTLDAAAMQSEEITFTGLSGIIVHAVFGTMVIPVVVLLLLISSFFARTPGAVKWALIVFVTTVVQIALGIFAHGVPQLGILHGIVALVLFGAAVMAGMRATKPVAATEPAAAEPTAPVATV